MFVLQERYFPEKFGLSHFQLCKNRHTGEVTNYDWNWLASKRIPKMLYVYLTWSRLSIFAFGRVIYRVSHDYCLFWRSPFLLDICWRNRLSFYVVNRHCAGFDFLKEEIWISFLFRVRDRCKFSLVFRLSMVCSKLKFKFSAGIQLFCLKTTSHGKWNNKNEFFRSGLPC